MVAVVQAVAHDLLDETDIHGPGPVDFLEDRSPDVVLGDDGEAAAVPRHTSSGQEEPHAFCRNFIGINPEIDATSVIWIRRISG